MQKSGLLISSYCVCSFFSSNFQLTVNWHNVFHLKKYKKNLSCHCVDLDFDFTGTLAQHTALFYWQCCFCIAWNVWNAIWSKEEIRFLSSALFYHDDITIIVIIIAALTMSVRFSFLHRFFFCSCLMCLSASVIRKFSFYPLERGKKMARNRYFVSILQRSALKLRTISGKTVTIVL